jgi:hypothetical protein
LGFFGEEMSFGGDVAVITKRSSGFIRSFCTPDGAM